MILPAGFGELFKESLGSSAYERYSSAISANPEACVRINPSKFSRGELRAQWPDAQQVPWCSNGFYLPERPNFTLDPLFHAGAYYVQDASSMFLEALLRQIESCGEYFARNAASGTQANTCLPGVSAMDSALCALAGMHADSVSDPAAGSSARFAEYKSLRVLDLCAAPGGKSTHLLSLIGPDSLLVSNEVISSRATILKENLEIWGSSNAVVTSSDSEVFAANLPEFFDIVLVDAPCSGEGMFRKMDSVSGNAAVDNWSMENVKLCAARQQRILSSAVKCLKPGGWLIYSTCTYNHFENDDQLSFLKSEFGFEVHPVAFFDAFSAGTGFKTSGPASEKIHGSPAPEIFSRNSIPEKCSGNSTSTLIKTLNGGYQFIPGLVRGEGQFCALLHLPENQPFPDSASCPAPSLNLSPLGDSSIISATAIASPASFANSVSGPSLAEEKFSYRLSEFDGNDSGKNNTLHNRWTMRNKQSAHESLNISFEKRTGSYGNNCNHGKFRKHNKPYDIKLQKTSGQERLPEAVESLCAAINQYNNNAVVKQQGALYKILPRNIATEIDCVASVLRVLGSGVALGCVKGKDFIPDAQLATSELLGESNLMDSATVATPKSGLCGKDMVFKVWDVDRETAIKFLAKRLNVLENAPLGVLLICYRGKGLGFVKNIGRRVNNLLPNARRILNL